HIRIEESEFDFAAYNRFLTENAGDIAAFRERQQAAFSAEVTRWQAQENTAAEQTQPVAIQEQEEQSGQLVSADLNGNIWKILVEPGQRVRQGEPLVVVEAMKMELMVHAPSDGVVSRISCQQGRPVSPGDALLWLG
ncbi:acetyl-CoA carboxylase biotin carboxyl carrier protein subunit, partial [Franconibacter helveticus]